jgi:hypothetical protein
VVQGGALHDKHLAALAPTPELRITHFYHFPVASLASFLFLRVQVLYKATIEI